MDISAIGRQFGLNDAQTRAAFEALAPVVAAGLRRNISTPGGLQDLIGALATGGHDRYVSDASALGNAKGEGDAILGHIFGSKDVSREVAAQLSAQTGIGAALLKKMLPVIATILMGQLAKNLGGSGGLGSILGSILGGAAKSAGAGSGGGLGDILGQILGGGQAAPEPAPAPRPRSTGSGGGFGDILKDILGGGQTQAEAEPAPQRRAPAPQGGSGGGSLEDMLNDILGGNGRVVVKQLPPDQMGNILRDIFGGQIPGFPGGMGGDSQAPAPDRGSVGRRTIDDMLGGGTRSGDAAGDLLDSVERNLRRR